MYKETGLENTYDNSTDEQDPLCSLPDFETLSKLAKEDPAALEALRINLCNQIINQAPDSIAKRLQGLQFKIDMERRRAKSPMACCLKISSMMHDSLLELKDALHNPQEYLRQRQAENKPHQSTGAQITSAEIIPLRSGIHQK